MSKVLYKVSGIGFIVSCGLSLIMLGTIIDISSAPGLFFNIGVIALAACSILLIAFPDKRALVGSVGVYALYRAYLLTTYTNLSWANVVFVLGYICVVALGVVSLVNKEMIEKELKKYWFIPACIVGIGSIYFICTNDITYIVKYISYIGWYDFSEISFWIALYSLAVVEEVSIFGIALCLCHAFTEDSETSTPTFVKTEKKVVTNSNTRSQANLLSAADELKKLKDLLDQGLINQEDYDKKKAEYLKF